MYLQDMEPSWKVCLSLYNNINYIPKMLVFFFSIIPYYSDSLELGHYVQSANKTTEYLDDVT